MQVPDIKVTLRTFNDIVTIADASTICEHLDTIRPGGMTPLYDRAVPTFIGALDLVGDESRVSVAIVTDGEENASKRYNFRDVSAYLALLKEKNVPVTFIGDEFKNVDISAKAIGIDIRNTVAITELTRGAFFNAHAAKSASYYATGQASTMGYSDEERRKLGS